MARAPWLIDSRRFATKIKNPTFDPSKEDRNGGLVRKCPNCNYEIDNSDVAGFRVATFEGNASTINLTYQAVNDQANYDSLQGVSDHTNVNLDNSTWQGLTCRENISLDDSSLLPKESQLKVDSQQLLDDFLFCAETVQNPSPQNLILDPVEYGRIKAKELDKAVNASDAIPCLDNIELDTPPDIENIELNFNSQESLSAWTRDKTH